MATNTFVDLPRITEAQTLADYTSIHYDLFTARGFAELYLQEFPKPQSPHDLLDALMVATVIRYARPFIGGIRLRLPVTILSVEQLTKHNYFLDVRSKYIVHSVNAFEESQPIARYWAETVEAEGIESVECNHARIIGLSEQEFRDIINLIDAWLTYVKENLQAEKRRLLEIVRRMPLQKVLQGYRGPAQLNTSRPNKRREPFDENPLT